MMTLSGMSFLEEEEEEQRRQKQQRKKRASFAACAVSPNHGCGYSLVPLWLPLAEPHVQHTLLRKAITVDSPGSEPTVYVFSAAVRVRGSALVAAPR